jgi:hypothetical protein
MTAIISPDPRGDRTLTGVAWGTTILISALPDIACVELTGSLPPFLVYGKIAFLLVLGVIASTKTPFRPLRNFFFIMIAFFCFTALRPALDFTVTPLQSLFGAHAFDLRMQAEQTGKLAVSFAMIVSLLLLGYRRRDFFLARGDLRAPIEPVPILGFPKPDPWPVFGLQWGIYIAAALAAIQYLGMRPGSDLLMRVVPILPSIVFYAAFNAFNEEITYRAPMLATLERVGGSRHALWMSAYFFGIAHYFGTPGGIPGAIASIFMGWILGKAMVETRGLFWAWWMHFLSDVAIFVFIGLALLR